MLRGHSEDKYNNRCEFKMHEQWQIVIFIFAFVTPFYSQGGESLCHCFNAICSMDDFRFQCLYSGIFHHGKKKWNLTTFSIIVLGFLNCPIAIIASLEKKRWRKNKKAQTIRAYHSEWSLSGHPLSFFQFCVYCSIKSLMKKLHMLLCLIKYTLSSFVFITKLTVITQNWMLDL